MRGRWASAAIGASVAKSRASAAGEKQAQAAQAQQQQAQQQIQAQQKQIEALQHPQQPQQEDQMQKLQKYADLKQKGIITDEEYQKLKTEVLSKMLQENSQNFSICYFLINNQLVNFKLVNLLVLISLEEDDLKNFGSSV